MKVLFPILASSLLLAAAPVIAADYNTVPQSSMTGASSTAAAALEQLKDGTTIEVDANNNVQKVNSDGSRSQVADGTYKLKEGGKIVVKDGKKTS